MMHWPLGVARARFVPLGGRTGFQMSPVLLPFETAGLREDLIILHGLSQNGLNAGGGGGPEGGTVMAVTGANCPGTRVNGGESDDTLAGGPSFDQIFLKHVPALQRAGAVGPVNAICDARVDSFETSTQCLSYSHEQQLVESVRSGLVRANVPILPELSPSELYANVFSGFMPGSGMKPEALKALRLRKSVLDSSLRELARIRTLAPASQRDKLDIHTDAIRKVELQIEGQLSQPASCTLPTAPDPNIRAKSGSRFDYANPQAAQADDVMVAHIGDQFLAIIRAAFQCDLARVATFQWCPGTNHVAFQGMYPADPAGAYMHNPLLHRVGDPAFYSGEPPTTHPEAALYEFFCNVHTWFNQKTADALLQFKNAKDGFGNSLLDYTIAPFITDVGNPTNIRNPLPALIIGGKKLGMLGGQFFQAQPSRPHNDLWLTIAQAFFPDANVLEALAGEAFLQNTNHTVPLEGLWQKPT